MASKQRYRKLLIGPSDKVTARNSHVGKLSEKLQPVEVANG